MSQPQPVVLVVDDEAQIQRFLRPALENAGCKVIASATGRDALVQASTHAPDVMLLDLGLPDMDGVAVLRQYREWSARPVIVLSARGAEVSKVEALDAGADDYLTKPFGMQELMARLRVALRHAQRTADAAESAEYRTGELKVDLIRRQVWVAGREVHLTPLEYRLFTTLVRHAGKVATHQLLLREVWGETYVNQTHYLRIFMRQLRHKLEADPARPRYLQTEAGVGYRLREE